MTQQEVRNLRQQRSRLVNEMHDLTTDSGKWNARSDSGRSQAQERFDKINHAQQELAAQISRAESDLLDAEMREVRVPPQGQVTGFPSGMPGAPESREVELPPELLPFKRDLESKSYRKAFDSFLRRGMDGVSTSERSALTDLAMEYRTYTGMGVGASTGGATLVPVGFQKELEAKLKSFGGMRRNARIVPTSTGNPLHWPTLDDTSNTGEFLAENAPVSQLNPTTGEVLLNSYLASSKQVLISVQLLQDSAFPIESVLAEQLGIRLGRVTESAYTIGGGTTLPTGIITSILADGTPLTVTAAGSNANDGVSTNTGANSIGTDDLSAIIEKVDPLYRVGGMFMAHFSTLDYLRKVKDKYGRPLFIVSAEVGAPDKIFGYPFDWNAAMDSTVNGVPAASKNSVIFGNFSKYVVRDVLGMTLMRYNELYMPNHQVGFQAFLRTDGLRIQQAAFSLLVQHS